MTSAVETGLFLVCGALGGSFVAGVWQFVTAKHNDKGTDNRFWVERFEKELARLDKDLGEARDEIKAAEIERTSLTNQIAELQEKARAHDQEKEALKASHAILLAEKLAEAKSLEGKIARLQQRVKELEKKELEKASKNPLSEER